jgi:hypothetical protein
MVGRAFKTNAYDEVYRIATFISSTSMTLEENFNGTTATDGSYTIAQDTYDLPEDFDGELNFLQFASPWNLEVMSPADLDNVRFGPWGSNILGTTDALTTDSPKRATIRGVKGGRLQLQLDPFSNDAIQIRFSYYAMLPKFVGNDDEWPFPSYLESTLHDGTMYYIRHNSQDDARGQVDLQKFFGSRNELAGLQRLTDMAARFQPDTGVRRLRKQRRRMTPGRVDYGSAFDRVY